VRGSQLFAEAEDTLSTGTLPEAPGSSARDRR